MLAVSSRREDTDGVLGEGETGEGSVGGQGDSGGEDSAIAASREGHEVAEEHEIDGLLEGPGSSRLFTLQVVLFVVLLFEHKKMESYMYLETLSRLVVDTFS